MNDIDCILVFDVLVYDVIGIQVFVVVSIDGFVLVQVGLKGYVVDCLVVMISLMFGLVSVLGCELYFGEFDIFIFDVVNGKVLMFVIFGIQFCLLMIVCDYSCVIGNVLWYVKQCVWVLIDNLN